MKISINILSLLLLFSSVLYADNTVGGEDMPWEEEDEGGDPTTIETPDTPIIQYPSPNNLYDLQGRKVLNPQPGNIYICHGRKIIWTKQ